LLPSGSVSRAAASSTVRRLPGGATFATSSVTSKKLFKKAMLPGITMTPGMGGSGSSPNASLARSKMKPCTSSEGVASPGGTSRAASVAAAGVPAGASCGKATSSVIGTGSDSIPRPKVNS
jgi:hypothetical protein